MKEAKVWIFKVWKLTWNKSFTFFFFLIIKRSTWIYLRRTLRLKNYRGQNTIGIRKGYNWKFGRKTNEDTWKYANKGVGLFLSLTVFPLGLGFLLYIDLKVKSSLDTYAENIFSWKIISRKFFRSLFVIRKTFSCIWLYKKITSWGYYSIFIKYKTQLKNIYMCF